MNEQKIAYSFSIFVKVLKALKLTKFKAYGQLQALMAGAKIANKYQRRDGRKPRTTSKSICCDNLGCDPFWPETPAKKKLSKRIKLGLCRGCGNKPAECRCKRKEK
jgi:hypothetical protein